MSITAVPLRPVNKSGIIMLWVGLALLAIAAIAWALTLSSIAQVRVTTIREGTGRAVTASDVAIVKYEGRLADGTVFDSNEQAPLPVGRMIPGFAQGLQRMRQGGSYTLNIPAELGYGATANGPIPANSDLEFDVEILDLKTEAEMQQIMAMQQMMQQQGGAGGAPGEGPPGTAPGGQ
jgi:FKBP-type peptidyl-prolyl cis-trans isomerase FkpA